MSRSHTTVRAARGTEWSYAPPQAAHWDEYLDPEGRVRPHWRRLAGGLRRLGLAEFRKRAEGGQRLIEANGITYNVYGDPRGKERPWRMDPMPLAMGEEEWRGLERAVAQRAALLNAVLADLYGPQRLLRDGLLPPELIFANPGFLRACHGIVPSSGVFLQNYAVDLGRSPDGRWWVIADRTQAPSGFGYALENRLVSARTLPSMLDSCRVQSLVRFHELTFDALLGLAPYRSTTPRVVLLSPGPHNETYFEHSYLSKHWGVPLVGGDDLTVRDGRVYLKTLAGLDQIDVIVRRLDDDFSDPLELRGDSLLGVPGLVHAVRSGTVYVANALGSGLVEAPSLMAFLPSLCRYLLGETLLLPSVATWWCGQHEPRSWVLDNLEKVVVKPTFPQAGLRAEFPAMMTVEQRRNLVARITARPEAFVAQEQVELSTAPILTPRGLEPRHVVLRAIAAWDGTAHSVLPGGLTRVATANQSLVVSMQLGGGSKDTWVVGTSRARSGERRLAVRPAPTSSVSTELSSRMADNLFWLGRYAERLESTARLIRVLLPGLSGGAEFSRGVDIDTILHFLGGLKLLPPELHKTSSPQQWWRLQGVLAGMVFDVETPLSVGWSLRQIGRLSWDVKERLSEDTWKVLQQLERGFTPPPPSPDRRFLAALQQLDQIVVMMSAFVGLLTDHPSRGHGWRFLELGRRVERALQMTEWLRVGVAKAPLPDDGYLEVLLQVADNSAMYRARYLTAIRTRYVLELLLVDETNPRSVAYQVVALGDRMSGLPTPSEGAPADGLTNGPRLLAHLRAARLDELKRRDSQGKRFALEAHLTTVHTEVTNLADALAACYLSHSTPSRLAPSR